MDQSLNLLLDDINKASDGLKSQSFKPPGIFHNAIVKHLTTQNVIDFTKILRDTKDRESSMFRIDKHTRVVKRKDNKEGIFDFLADREVRNRRNRNLGIVDPKPIIQIPKRFYLEQQRLEFSNSIDLSGLNKIYNPNSKSQYSQLLTKFANNNDAQALLISLFQGSVIIEDDIPMKIVMEILDAINTMWPGAESAAKQHDLTRQFLRLKEMKDKLEKDVEEQETKIMERSSNDIQRLIEEKHNELTSLEAKILEKKQNGKLLE